MKSVFSAISVLVMCVTAVYAEASAAAGKPDPIGSFMPLIVIFAIFYFLLIRPQQKKAKEHEQMLNAIKKDDKVVTTGGVLGTVTAVKGTIIEIKIADEVKVQVLKSAISSLQQPEEPTVVTPVVESK